MRTAPNRLLATALLLGLSCTLSACGTKGPLTLPPPPSSSAKPAPVKPTATPAAADATTQGNAASR